MVASIWAPGSPIPANAANTLVSQVFTSAVSQAVFNITDFSYIPNSGTLWVIRDGLKLLSTDYVESSATSFTLNTPASLGDQIEAIGFIQMASLDSATLQANLASSNIGYGSKMVAYILRAAGAVKHWVEDKFAERISIFDFLTDAEIADVQAGTASLDLWVAFNYARTACRGKKLRLPKGQYYINTDSGALLLEEIKLEGEMVLDGASLNIDQGTVIRVKGTTNSLFSIRRGTQIKGIGFYYPDQGDTSTPTVYPTTLNFDFSNGAVQFVYIQENVCYNAYRFCDINDAAGNVGHIWIEDNSICVFNRGIYLRNNLEHIRIHGNDFTFGIWAEAVNEANARLYMRTNCTYIKVDQSDGLDVTGNLMYGALNGILASAVGLCQMQKYVVNSFDAVRYPIKAIGAGNCDALIAENEFDAVNGQNTALQGRSISIETTGAGRDKINIGVNAFNRATEEHIYSTGNVATRTIIVSPQVFLSWAAFKAAGTYGALNINGTATNLIISGCSLIGANASAFSNGIVGTFNTFTCNGVAFDSCFKPIEVTVTLAAGSGNQSFVTGHTVSDTVTATTRVWGPNNFDKSFFKSPLGMTVALLGNYVNDAAAAGGGIPVGGTYRNGSIQMIRVA